LNRPSIQSFDQQRHKCTTFSATSMDNYDYENEPDPEEDLADDMNAIDAWLEYAK